MSTIDTDLPARGPTGATLVLRYAAFAAFAIVVNLSAQQLFLQLYGGPLALTAALVVGTIAGLIPKYILDKIWIFADEGGGHAKKFTLYTVLSVATTVIFWSTEITFNWLGQGDWLIRSIGGGLGLTIGYIVKYQLDRRITFAPS